MKVKIGRVFRDDHRDDEADVVLVRSLNSLVKARC
jgi:hypothetical protein